MSLLNEIKKLFSSATKKVADNVKKEFSTTRKTYSFNELPADLEAFKKLPGADLKDPYAVVALTVLAYDHYSVNKEESYAMLDFLRGPRPLSNFEKSSINDRWMDGKDYVTRSYFAGAVPANNYTPQKPYRVTVSDNPYSRDNEGYLVLYLTSGGADSPRPVTVRQKASTQEWFLWDTPGILADIRTPAERDPWA